MYNGTASLEVVELVLLGEIVTVAELLFCVLYWKGKEIGLCDTPILFPGLDYVNLKRKGLGDLSCHDQCSPSVLSKVYCDLREL